MSGAVNHNSSVRNKRLVDNFSKLYLVVINHLRKSFQGINISTVSVDSDNNIGGLLLDLKNITLLVWYQFSVDNDAQLNKLSL
jgi:hypothetical protein